MAQNGLSNLVRNMSPELHSGDFVFSCVSDLKGIDERDLMGFFREKEGLTVILTKEKAVSKGLEFDGVFSCITLTVVSDLQDIGLTAAFSTALSTHQISCNVVAGYHHDHIFVPKKDANRALKTLKELSKG